MNVKSISSICINCGSNSGRGDVYLEAAVELAQYLAQHKIKIVYGGAAVGLMGKIADTALQLGGEVVGVIPNSIADKVGHKGLTKLYLTNTMHERKALMFKLSDAFIGLPGGYGTLEEIFEVLTWAQLGESQKPCGLLNVNGYYDELLNFLDHTVTEGFMRIEHREMLLTATTGRDLLANILKYQAPTVSKWIRNNSACEDSENL
ncbi:MAG: TIGR00730 family Rossman fold protein [Bdellovibrionota bacterium]|jgi:uncharacterized protein (TIGR00730 family)